MRLQPLARAASHLTSAALRSLPQPPRSMVEPTPRARRGKVRDRSRYPDRRAEWIKRNPEKRRAHEIVFDAVAAGTLVRQPCERCGEPAQAHHEDYSKPLLVTWLCPRHHKARHREMREQEHADPSPGGDDALGQWGG